jgi:hypothetical protein
MSHAFAVQTAAPRPLVLRTLCVRHGTCRQLPDAQCLHLHLHLHLVLSRPEAVPHGPRVKHYAVRCALCTIGCKVLDPFHGALPSRVDSGNGAVVWNRDAEGRKNYTLSERSRKCSSFRDIGYLHAATTQSVKTRPSSKARNEGKKFLPGCIASVVACPWGRRHAVLFRPSSSPPLHQRLLSTFR